jgi:GxxExxY protein
LQTERKMDEGRVHRALGPGLLESVYMSCLIYEIRTRGFMVVSERPVAIQYKDLLLDGGYRLDLMSKTPLLLK